MSIQCVIKGCMPWHHKAVIVESLFAQCMACRVRHCLRNASHQVTISLTRTCYVYHALVLGAGPFDNCMFAICIAFVLGAGPCDNCTLVVCIAYVWGADPCDNCMFAICIMLEFGGQAHLTIACLPSASVLFGGQTHVTIACLLSVSCLRFGGRPI